jgi:hypothetical protein
VTGAGALVTFASIAQAGNPPMGPGNIEIFAKRDMVALEGYKAQAGETATVTVQRGDQTIGIGEGTLDETGFLEFNHPGGECWVGVTPNISAGDEVSVSFSEATFTDAATVGSAKITSVTPSPVTATPEVGDVEGTVTIKGTYGADIDPARFVVEVVNPTMRDVGAIGERAIGWVPNDDPADPHNGGPGHTATGTFEGGQFEAVFGLQSAADQKLVMEGDHVALSWMADGDGDLALGATQYEFEEIDGPGFGGCPAGPGAQPPVGPSTASLASAKDATSVDVTWSQPTQPANSSVISAYRVSAIGGDYSSQEVAVRTSGTTATLQGLEADAPYEIKIEAYNGQWSPANSVGTVTVGSGAGGTPPGGGTDPGSGATSAPAAPTGVTASATSSGGADVSWTASTGATSYTVSASSTVAGAATPQPVTVQAPTTDASLAGLTPGTAYTVSVTAANAAGTSAAAGTSTVTTTPAAKPGAFNLTRVVPGHERITAEWSAAQPGNAASTITGYDLVATPTGGTATVVTTTVTGLTGTLTGLGNGTEYTVTVVAKSGSATTPASVPTSVKNKVTPNDVVTVGRAEYRTSKNEYRVTGTAQDTTGNSVTVRITGGAIIQSNVPVGADGAWSISARTNIVLPAGATLTVTSTSGANLTGVVPTRK